MSYICIFIYLFGPKTNNTKFEKKFASLQWRIQAFSEGDAKGCANLLFGQFFPKTAWNWRKLARRGGGGCPKFVCVSATTLADPWGIINRRSLPQATSFHFHAVFGIDALTFGAVAPVWEILDPPLQRNCLYWFSPVMLNFKWSNFFYKLKFEQVSCFSTK